MKRGVYPPGTLLEVVSHTGTGSMVLLRDMEDDMMWGRATEGETMLVVSVEEGVPHRVHTVLYDGKLWRRFGDFVASGGEDLVRVVL